MRYFPKKKDVMLVDILNGLNQGVVENVDLSLETVVWRIHWRQPGFQECVAELLKNKYPQYWNNSLLIETLQKNLDLLAEDLTLTRLYDLVVELKEKLSAQEIEGVKKLVTAAFVLIPPDTIDRHICALYVRYRYWPSLDSLSPGEITTAFNKLTICQPTAKVMDVYKLVLQNAELVLYTIVERAITSKGQFTVYSEILKSIPGVCTSSYYDNSSINLLPVTFDHFLRSRRQNEMEQKNTLIIVMEMLEVQKLCTDKPLLDPSQFLTNTVLPFLNVNNLYSNNQPITARFALELLMEVIGGHPRQKRLSENHRHSYAVNIFHEIHFPAVFLCICELAHECIDLMEDNNVLLIEKLKIKEELYHFWCWLDQEKCVQEEILQCKGSWLLEEITRFDFTVQLIILVYVSPDKFDKTFQNICTGIMDKGVLEGNICNIIRMLYINNTIFENICTRFGEADIQLDYGAVIVALTQVLPILIEAEWKPCLSFVGSMLIQQKLAVPSKTRNRNIIPDNNLIESKEFKISQILKEVTTLLQYTDVGQNKLLLNHYLKSYVKYINDYIMCHNALEEQSLLLSEVFEHVVIATWWMDESDSEPCSAVLLDIVCRLENAEINNESKRLFAENITQNVRLIKTSDTSCMIDKKLKDILKTI